MTITSRTDSSVPSRPLRASLLALLAAPLLALSAGCIGDASGQDEEVTDSNSAALTALSANDKTLAFNSFNNAFYVGNNGNGYYVTNTNRAVPQRTDFWRVCETIEAAEDAYDRAKTPGNRDLVNSLLNGLNNVVSGTIDFASWNKFNDDVMWAVIALVRGYEITGNHDYLNQAMWQFNVVWDRAWDNKLGGGLWWTTDRGEKNACINGPAAIAAMLLARNTTNTGYRSQADQIYNWMKSTIVNTSTGQIADHINANGEKVWWAFTYNQGTYVGAATLLYQATNNAGYRNDASQAVNWARHNLTGNHVADIINDEYNAGDGGNDTAGFKGILVRWAGKYALATNDNDIKNWLSANAAAAWNYRNSSGIMWGQWWHRAADASLTSWEASGGVAVTQAIP